MHICRNNVFGADWSIQFTKRLGPDCISKGHHLTLYKLCFHLKNGQTIPGLRRIQRILRRGTKMMSFFNIVWLTLSAGCLTDGKRLQKLEQVFYTHNCAKMFILSYESINVKYLKGKDLLPRTANLRDKCLISSIWASHQ